MNFTNHTKLNDAEFKVFYKELFCKSPRPSDYKTEEYWEKVKLRQQEFLNNQEKTLLIPELPDEIWKQHPSLKTYEVSNLGRIKIRNVIQRQIDTQGKLGYLVLERYPKVLVYRLVADTYLNRLQEKYYEVHHIDNNGYDCSEDNLILLKKWQHKAIHKNEMEDYSK
ncbi:MAG: hypothetical protein SPH83_01600 [Treponema sp.]|nr:hypothetical protein [Spirochaetales bacterium]MDY6189173.1 hypothetical protein [Treponema sp.]